MFEQDRPDTQRGERRIEAADVIKASRTPVEAEVHGYDSSIDSLSRRSSLPNGTVRSGAPNVK